MTESTILVVDDEKSIRDMLRFSLERAGYAVQEAADASEAQLRLGDGQPDLIVLDWMMPGMSGLELARRLKRDEFTRGIPIIMLTARGEEDDKISGLEIGADDYVSKPFSPRELLARIRAVMRRVAGFDSGGPVRAGGLELDPDSHRVSADGEEIHIGPTEFRLLHFMMDHPDRVYSRGQLLDHVWGRNAVVEERTVDVHILRLRKALLAHACHRYIQTVRGAGYRFSTKD
jgi:two-component system phosphate regulon response regulator PhoB